MEGFRIKHGAGDEDTNTLVDTVAAVGDVATEVKFDLGKVQEEHADLAFVEMAEDEVVNGVLVKTGESKVREDAELTSEDLEEDMG